MTKILALHGINHNMFGMRDPAQYGTVTLQDIYHSIESLAAELGVEVENRGGWGNSDRAISGISA